MKHLLKYPARSGDPAIRAVAEEFERSTLREELLGLWVVFSPGNECAFAVFNFQDARVAFGHAGLESMCSQVNGDPVFLITPDGKLVGPGAREDFVNVEAGDE